MPEEIKNFPVSATASASAKITVRLIPFPTQWETSLDKFVSEPEFDAILTELGRLAAADSNQTQEIFDALSYLINKNEYGTVARFVVQQLRNRFDDRTTLLRSLHNSQVPDQVRQDELDVILKDAKTWHDSRNQFVHSRWGIPDKVSGGVVRINFDVKSGRDTFEPVKPVELKKISDEMEKCTKQLREFFWRSFGDYHEWLAKRMPPP